MTITVTIVCHRHADADAIHAAVPNGSWVTDIDGQRAVVIAGRAGDRLTTRVARAAGEIETLGLDVDVQVNGEAVDVDDLVAAVDSV